VAVTEHFLVSAGYRAINYDFEGGAGTDFELHAQNQPHITEPR
jgi:hypothetical protein